MAVISKHRPDSLFTVCIRCRKNGYVISMLHVGHGLFAHGVDAKPDSCRGPWQSPRSLRVSDDPIGEMLDD